MNNVIFSLRAVLPTFIIIMVGFFLRSKKIVSSQFIAEASTVAFYVGFPCNVFCEITSYGKPSQLINPRFILFVCGMTLTTFLCAFFIAPLLTQNSTQKGAVIHGIFRSNYIVMGSMLASSVFGEAGSAALVTLYPFIVPLYITLAVIGFAVYMPANSSIEKGEKGIGGMILHNIAKTPIMWGAIVGFIVSWSGFSLPYVASKSISTAAALATPLSLLSLGGQLNFSKKNIDIKIVSTVSILKLIVVPAAAVILAICFNFNTAEIGATLLVFGTPVALTGFVLSKNMHSDYELTSQLILITLFFSAFTLFVGIFLLRTFGYI